MFSFVHTFTCIFPPICKQGLLLPELRRLFFWLSALHRIRGYYDVHESAGVRTVFRFFCFLVGWMCLCGRACVIVDLSAWLWLVPVLARGEMFLFTF